MFFCSAPYASVWAAIGLRVASLFLRTIAKRSRGSTVWTPGVRAGHLVDAATPRD
jgi:hypothetical protein